MSSRDDFFAILEDLCTPETKPGEKKDIDEVYRTWADKYDQDMVTHWGNGRGHDIIAQELMRLLGDQKEAKIMDLGAGTGRCGEEFYKRGYRNLDALDASREMLDRARQKGTYRNVICDYVGPNKLDIPDDTYDGIVLTGMFVPRHANDSGFEEIIRIMKPGAYFSFYITEKYLDYEEFRRFEPRIEELTIRGFWKVHKRERREFQTQLQDGSGAGIILFVIQKL